MSSLCSMALAPVLLLPLAGALLSPSDGDRDRESGGRGLTVVFPSLASRKISPQLDDGSFEKKQVRDYFTLSMAC